MARDKVVGKSVKFEGEGDVALEFIHRRSGAVELVGVRRVPSRRIPDVPDLEFLKLLDIVSFNSEAEKVFVELLAAMAAGENGVPIRIVRAEIAYKLGVSTETVKRYIEKWCAPSAPFEIKGGQIFLKKEKEKEDG